MNKILLQLNEKTIKVLAVLLGIVIIVVGLMVSVSPILGSIQKNAAAIAKLDAQKNQIESNITRYSSLEKYSKELDVTAAYLNDKFPESSNVPDLISDIANAAQKAGMDKNNVANVTVGTPTQIVEPLGQSGEAVCTALKPGDFAIIIPDIKNSTPDNKIYIMCTEEAIKGLGPNAFYNAATDNAARTCVFAPDIAQGTKFFISVKKCGSGTILPALRESSVQPVSGGQRVPSKPIIALVQGEVAQMSLTITIDSGVGIETIDSFVNNLYGMRRAITINTIKTGVSADRDKTTYTVITGFVYSHTKTVTAKELESSKTSSTSAPEPTPTATGSNK